MGTTNVTRDASNDQLANPVSRLRLSHRTVHGIPAKLPVTWPWPRRCDYAAGLDLSVGQGRICICEVIFASLLLRYRSPRSTASVAFSNYNSISLVYVAKCAELESNSYELIGSSELLPVRQ